MWVFVARSYMNLISLELKNFLQLAESMGSASEISQEAKTHARCLFNIRKEHKARILGDWKSSPGAQDQSKEETSGSVKCSKIVKRAPAGGT